MFTIIILIIDLIAIILLGCSFYRERKLRLSMFRSISIAEYNIINRVKELCGTNSDIDEICDVIHENISLGLKGALK